MSTLIVIRHGDAVSGPVDRDRALSPLGCEQVRAVASAFRARGVRIDEIRHSGLARARETAEILADGLDRRPRIVEAADIDSGDDPEIFTADLDGFRGTIAIVSHMPFVRRLSAVLLDGAPDRGGMTFTTGTAACFDRESEESGWRVLWVERPD